MNSTGRESESYLLSLVIKRRLEEVGGKTAFLRDHVLPEGERRRMGRWWMWRGKRALAKLETELAETQMDFLMAWGPQFFERSN